jgi:hypothetical protein
MALGLPLKRQWCPLVLTLLACRGEQVALPPAATGATDHVGLRRMDGSAVTSPSAGGSSKTSADVAQSFIVNGRSLALHDLNGRQARVLATEVDTALYDEAFGLIWVKRQTELNVVDLQREYEETVIAGGLPPGYHLTVQHERRSTSTLQPETTCDPANRIVLDWTRDPALRLDELHRGPIELGLHPNGRAWLIDHWSRAIREPAERVHFDSARASVSVAGFLLDCDTPDSCGKALALGSTGLDLVLVRDRWGADCNHYGCLFRDRQTGRFATPPLAPSWGEFAGTPAGSCGPYFFNRAATAFLVGDYACPVGKQCSALDGQALGWLTPGPIFGERSIDF